MDDVSSAAFQTSLSIDDESAVLSSHDEGGKDGAGVASQVLEDAGSSAVTASDGAATAPLQPTPAENNDEKQVWATMLANATKDVGAASEATATAHTTEATDGSAEEAAVAEEAEQAEEEGEVWYDMDDEKYGPRVFLEFSVHPGGDEPKECTRFLGRVVFRLFRDRLPIATENFLCLCTGEKGTLRVPKDAEEWEQPRDMPLTDEEGWDVPLHYLGAPMHRVCPGFLIQGGDILRGDGTGSISIYGKGFEDEGPFYKQDQAGLLCMANRGGQRDTLASQFFVTTSGYEAVEDCSVFGRVVAGMDAIREIEDLELDQESLVEHVFISGCGVLASEQVPTGVQPPEGESWPGFPEDAACKSPEALMAAAAEIREAGNKMFQSGRYLDAITKYGKALRYARDEARLVHQIPCYLNRSLCHTKLGNFRAAIADADAVIAVDPGHSKALFRKGQALAAWGDHRSALEVLKAAQRLAPADRSIMSALNASKAEVKADNQAQGARLASMFGGKLKSDQQKAAEALAEEKAKKRETLSFEAAWAAAGDEAVREEEPYKPLSPSSLEEVAEAEASQGSTFEKRAHERRGSLRLGWSVGNNAI